MVVYDPEGYKKKKDEERRLSTPEDVKKERLLNEFRKESASIILLAFMYAKNFEEMGYDITEKWVTAQQQSEVLEKAQKKYYLEGYEFGFTKGREYEREWIERKNNNTEVSVFDPSYRKNRDD